MFLLAFHIVAVGIMVVAVWGIAYRAGQRAGERHLRRQLGMETHPRPAGRPAADSSSERA